MKQIITAQLIIVTVLSLLSSQVALADIGSSGGGGGGGVNGDGVGADPTIGGEGTSQPSNKRLMYKKDGYSVFSRSDDKGVDIYLEVPDSGSKLYESLYLQTEDKKYIPVTAGKIINCRAPIYISVDGAEKEIVRVLYQHPNNAYFRFSQWDLGVPITWLLVVTKGNPYINPLDTYVNNKSLSDIFSQCLPVDISGKAPEQKSPSPPPVGEKKVEEEKVEPPPYTFTKQLAKKSLKEASEDFVRRLGLLLTKPTTPEKPRTYLGQNFASRGSITIKATPDKKGRILIVAKTAPTETLKNIQVFLSGDGLMVTVVGDLPSGRTVAFKFAKNQVADENPPKNFLKIPGGADAHKIARDFVSGFGIVPSLDYLIARASSKPAGGQSVFNFNKDLLGKRFRAKDQKIQSSLPTVQYSANEADQNLATICTGKKFRLDTNNNEFVC